MARKVESVVPNWIFALSGTLILSGLSLFFFMSGTSVGDEALKGLIKKEIFSSFELADLEIQNKSFDLSTFSWSFELKARSVKFKGLPIEISDLSVTGIKKINEKAELKKAVLRFSDSNKIIKGGAHLYLDQQGQPNWDLTNLTLSLGALEKKVGTPAFLVFDSQNENSLLAHLLMDGIKIPFEFTREVSSSVIQVPKIQIKTDKQRLPIKALSEIPTSGEWTLASRVELKNNLVSEASSLSVENALVNLVSVNSSHLRNARGLGVLSLNLASSEGMLNGDFHFDLQKSTFELNKGKFYKVEGMPFDLNVKFKNNQIDADLNTGGNSFLNAEIDKEGNLHARLKEFDFALIPMTQKILGAQAKGFATGGFKAKLVKDDFENYSLDLENVALENAELTFNSPQFPLLEVNGTADFWGSIYWDLNKKRIQGKFDLSKASVSAGSFFNKNDKEDLVFRIQAENVDKHWKTFEIKGDFAGTQAEVKLEKDFVKIHLPMSYKTQSGAIISGELIYPLCGNNVCERGYEPQEYDLELADFSSEIPFLRDLKLSGKISKKGDLYQPTDLVLRWPSGDHLKISGSLDKFKKAKLKITGDLNYSEAQLSNPFLFFKELTVQEADYAINILIREDKNLWSLVGDASLENKKLLFPALTLLQNKNTEYRGRAELNLESYLARGEPVSITATLDSKGVLTEYPELLLKGTFDANLVVGTSGLNLKEFAERIKLRATGHANLDQLPATLLIKQGLESYAKERQRDFARGLAKCYPKKLIGKFDFDYEQGRWNLSPSIFQGVDRDSFVRLQGSLGDLQSVNLISHYLPGSSCHRELAECVGDAFPKGGMSFEITGKFKDPETDLDFGFIDQSLERCREIKNRRELASDATPPVLDQNARIQELKNFYNSRNLSR